MSSKLEAELENNTENGQTKQERLFDEVFSNPLVLKEVLKHLGKSDLLRTSLVNKNWNILSREALQENEECLAIVEKEDFFNNLRKLKGLLSNSNAVLFNGISMTIPSGFDSTDQFVTPEELSKLMDKILGKMNLKYLTLRFPMVACAERVALECIRDIFLKKANTLERLRLKAQMWFGSPRTFSKLVGLNLQGQWLPKLQILKFESDEEEDVILRELIGAAPQLQRLCSTIGREGLEFILPLKAARAVKDFYFIPSIESLSNYAAFSLENPQLEKLNFTTGLYEDDTTPKFSHWSKFRQNEVSIILKQILRSSQDSLKNLTCDHYDLIIMTCRWNIPVLKKLAYFEFSYSSRLDEEEGYSTLTKINWTEHFPNLKEVSLSSLDLLRSKVERDFYIGHAFRASNVEFACESVEIFRWKSTHEVDCQMFKKIFPNVKELYLQSSQSFSKVMNDLWSWRDLELIDVWVDIKNSIPNYDSLFMGISAEEAAYLLENVDKLESMEIVSIKPSIFNLRKLKKMKIQVSHDEDLCRRAHSAPDTVFLSRLTGQCAFARVPGLVVEIYQSMWELTDYCQLALDHIKPFVECVECVYSNDRYMKLIVDL